MLAARGHGLTMWFSVLGSGSKGNAVYIEGGGTAILIDAGFSGKEIEHRLKAIGKSLSDVKALCLTHEHNDHICGAGVLSRRCRISLWANRGTFEAGAKRLGKLHRKKEFITGEAFTVDGLTIRSFRTFHDTADPVGFVIEDGKTSLGYCTDTGKTSHLMARRLGGCKALILEFNHNQEMLKNGPYPLALQQRVRSSLGHLSNDQAQAFLVELASPSLKHLVLAHLSEQNNTPKLAVEAAEKACSGTSAIKLHLAPQNRPLAPIEL